MPSSFEIVGVVLAVWAVVLSYMGLRDPEFPRSGRAEMIVAGVTILLVASAVASGITSSYLEYHEKHKETAASR